MNLSKVLSLLCFVSTLCLPNSLWAIPEYDITIGDTIDADNPTGLIYRDDGFWVLREGITDADDCLQHYSMAGSLLGEYDVPGSVSRNGLAWDGTYFWIADNNYGPEIIYKCSLNGTLSVVQSYTWSHTGPVGLEWAQGYLWVADNHTDTIYRVTVGATSFTSIESWCTTNPEPWGLAWDGSNMWSLSGPAGGGPGGSDGRREIYKHDADGDIIEIWHYPDGTGTGMAFDGSQLYYCDMEKDQIIEALMTEEPTTPEEQIEEIIEFIDSVSGETLYGKEKDINKMKEWLADARDYTAADMMENAWIKLYEVYLRTDGDDSPKEWVTGPSASDLKEQIVDVMEQLLPNWEFVFETDNALVYSITSPIGDARVGHALAMGAFEQIGTNALTYIIGGSSVGPVGTIAGAIGVVLEFLDALSEYYDPVRVLPSAPNLELKKDVLSPSYYAAEIPDDDPSYTAVVFLDFIGANWSDWMLDGINSDLELVSEGPWGGNVEDPINPLILLTQYDMKNQLYTDKSYIVVPKRPYFNANNLDSWPDESDGIFLRASFRQNGNTRSDSQFLYVEPK